MQGSLAGDGARIDPVNVGHQVTSGFLVLDFSPSLDQLLHTAIVWILGGDGLEDQQAGQGLVLAGLTVPALLVL